MTIPTGASKRFQNFLRSPQTSQRIHELHDQLTSLPVIPSSNNEKSQGCLTNFLTVYFNFSFALCSCPFRLVVDEQGWFSVSKVIPQLIACALLNILSCILMLSQLKTVVNSISSSKNQNPLEYFSLLSSFFSTTFQFMTLKRFWWNQDDYLHIVNFIRNERDALPKGKIKIQHKLFSRLICAIFAGMALYEILWRKIFAHSSTWQKTVWNRGLASEGRYILFMTNYTESKRLREPNELTGLDYFLAILIGLAWIERYILGYYIDLAMLFAVLTAWTASYLFARKLEDDLKRTSSTEYNWMLLAQTHIPSFALSHNLKGQQAKGRYKSNWQEIYRTYQSIRSLCEVVNKAIGVLVTLYLADCLLFQSTSMDNVLISPDWRVKARQLFFFCNYGLVFVLSADTCNKIESLKHWLAKDENRQDIPLDQLNVIMSELQSRMIGIRGSNIFTVTYPLLWNMITTVVTYFIICLQTRQQEKHAADAAHLPKNCTDSEMDDML